MYLQYCYLLISFIILYTDPGRVMDLLSQALSMDSLSDLLKKEHRDSSAQLQLLRDKLECMYMKHAFTLGTMVHSMM